MAEKEKRKPNKWLEIWDLIWDRRIEILSGALMLIGIVLAFFYIQLGGTLIGLGFGLCFYEEIYSYFLGLRNYYVVRGVFKTLMVIGTVIYFLISVPAFIIAAAIGFGAIFVFRWSFGHRKR